MNTSVLTIENSSSKSLIAHRDMTIMITGCGINVSNNLIIPFKQRYYVLPSVQSLSHVINLELLFPWYLVAGIIMISINGRQIVGNSF